MIGQLQGRLQWHRQWTNTWRIQPRCVSLSKSRFKWRM